MPLSPVSSTVDAGLVATRLSSALNSRNGRRVADHAIEAVRLGLSRAQLAHLAAQPRGLERLLDHGRERLEVERLVHEVVRAELHRLDGGVDAGVGREQDDEDVGIELLELLEDGQAVEVGQPVVENREVDARGGLLDGRLAVLGLEHVVAGRAQTLGDRPADQLFVVDDQNRFVCHG